MKQMRHWYLLSIAVLYMVSEAKAATQICNRHVVMALDQAC